MLRVIVLLMTFAACSGCGIVRAIAGADIDPEQFAKAREAAMLSARHEAALALAQRLASGAPWDQSDMVLYLSESALNKVAGQIIGRTGWLDPETPYTVNAVDVKLYNGSVVASLDILARSLAHNVDVALVMDCLLVLRSATGELEALVEPFNIAPDVKAGGFLSSFEDVIRDVVKVKLARLKSDFPPMRFPVELIQQLPVRESRASVRSGINLDIDFPRRLVNYRMTVHEVLVFERCVLVAMNLTSVDVK